MPKQPTPESVPLASFPQPKPEIDQGELDLAVATKMKAGGSAITFMNKLLKVADARGIEVTNGKNPSRRK